MKEVSNYLLLLILSINICYSESAPRQPIYILIGIANVNDTTVILVLSREIANRKVNYTAKDKHGKTGWILQNPSGCSIIVKI